MMYLNQRVGFVPQQDPCVMEVDRGNKNCYNCRGFGYLVRNCRNRGIGGRIGEGRKLEYENGNNRQKRMTEEENGQTSNLNGE